jgi:hypothetical protein
MVAPSVARAGRTRVVRLRVPTGRESETQHPLQARGGNWALAIRSTLRGRTGDLRCCQQQLSDRAMVVAFADPSGRQD